MTNPDSPASPSSSGLGSLSGIRVLIVEDEPMLLLLLEDMLAELGCVVASSAAQIGQAQAFLASGAAFDAAILDVRIGSESVGPIAAEVAARGLPIVLATGYSQSSVAERFPHAPVVQKPYVLTSVHRALIAALYSAGKN